MNGGSLRIIANRGYFREVNGQSMIDELSVGFPGTLFQLKFLVREDVVYTLRVE